MGNFTHFAVYGMTGQGKSTIMKRVAESVLAKGKQVVVFNPTGEEWPVGVVRVASVDQLEAVLGEIRRRRRWAMVLLDEARFLRLQVRPHHEAVTNLGPMGRHYPVTFMVASQFPTGVDPALRWNCGECYCFRLANVEAAQEVWKIYNQQSINGRPVWEIILSLPKLTCVHLTAEKAEILTVKPPGRGVVQRVKRRVV